MGMFKQLTPLPFKWLKFVAQDRTV